MIGRYLLFLAGGVLLAACQGPEVPQAGDVLSGTSTPSANRVAIDQSYDVHWSCKWNGPTSDWTLPAITVVDGEAMALNEWTRLDGAVLERETTATEAADQSPGYVGQLVLSGARKSEDGQWYDMSVAGPVYRDEPSQLHGFWKGGACQADLTPSAGEPDTSAGLPDPKG